MGLSRIPRLLMLILLIFVGSSCSDLKTQPQISENPQSEEYILVFKDGLAQKNLSANESKELVQSRISQLSERYKVQALQSYSNALRGGLYKLNAEQAKVLSKDPDVAYLEKNQIVSINGQQSSAPWGLDRIDQSSLPLNQTYNYPDVTPGSVHVYVIDTGIRSTHEEFEGRVQRGADFVDNDTDASDCNGHGTHVAGTIGGKRFGVAKSSLLYGVRVLDCVGNGTIAGVIAGVDWVTGRTQRPAVANMSLGGGVSQALDDAVQASVQSGVTYVVAAGNENRNACLSSPARSSAALTVGSSTRQDARSNFSNFGNCVDIFAPGSDIESAGINSNTSVSTLSGTSMAAPHAAGVAALYLAANPSASPQTVLNQIRSAASQNKLSQIGTGSPNLLLSSAFLLNSPPPIEPPNTILQNGETRSSLSAQQGQDLQFSIEVPAGSQNLRFEISGGNGDADIYVRLGSAPTLSEYDCRPYRNGNAETCTFEQAAAGEYYVTIRAFTTFSGVSLRVNYEVAESGPCQNCRLSDEGTLSSSQSYRRQFSTSDSKLQAYWLVGPLATDFDLYLYRLNRTTNSWSEVARSIGRTSEEQIRFAGDPGQYELRVHAYSGQGSFKVWQAN